jgi:hypothetical protein
MENSKKNLISEIVRINEIISGKKVITEATVNPIIDLVNQLVKMGTRSSTVRALQNQLKVKGATLAKKIEIINQLRDSSDQAIKDLIISYDTRIILAVLKSIPKITRGPQTIKAIEKLMNKGLTKKEIIEEVKKSFQNNYGRYADNLVDDFVADLNKAYDEIVPLPKPEPPAPKPDPEPVVNDTGIPLDDVAQQAVVDITNSNISRVIAEIDAPFYRRMINSLRGIFEYFGDGETIRNRILDKLYALERQYVDGRPLTDVEIVALKKSVKEDMDKIWNMNKDYVNLVEEAIENGKKAKTPDGNPDKRRQKIWTEMEDKLKTIKTKYGDWGVLGVTTPSSGKWLFLTEAILYAYRHPINAGKFIKNTIVNWSDITKSISNALKVVAGKAPDGEPVKYIVTPLKGWTPTLSAGFIPGSPRWIPKTMKKNLTTGEPLPNAYAEFFAVYKRYPKLWAWSSLVLEKMILAFTIELLSNLYRGWKDWKRFEATSRKDIMPLYGECVMTTADVMENGTISIDKPETLVAENMPPCLLDIIQSGVDERTLAQILVRADFFSRGEGGTEYISFVTRGMFDEAGYIELSKLFTGPMLNWTYQIYKNVVSPVYQSEITGDPTPLENELARLQDQLGEVNVRLEEETERISDAVEQVGEEEYIGPDFDQ